MNFVKSDAQSDVLNERVNMLLKHSETIIGDLLKQCEAEKTRADAAEHKLKTQPEKNETIQTLTDQLNRKTIEFAELQKKLYESYNRNSASQIQTKKLEKQVEELTKELETVKATNAAYDNQLIDMALVQTELNRANGKITELETKLNSQPPALNTTEIDQLRSRESALNIAYNHIHAAYVNLKHSLEEKNKQLIEVKNEVEKWKNESTTHTLKVCSLHHELGRIRGDLNLGTQRENELRNKLEKIEEMNKSNTSKEIESRIDEINNLRLEIHGLKHKIFTNHIQHNQDLDNIRLAHRQELNNMEARFDSYADDQDEIQRLSETNEALESEVTELAKQLLDCRDIIKSMEFEHAEHTCKIRNLLLETKELTTSRDHIVSQRDVLYKKLKSIGSNLAQIIDLN